ncbi:HAD family hydrolase [Oceanobacillus luteolus]|uniref:HAD family hydrolase n=1 Tax=Oceanobacillus luteolus TaxID=1274358 RepID=UPI0032E7F67A
MTFTFQMNNIKALGIEDYFETILISEWVGMKKPEPIIFQQALKELDVLPSESIFVGDHPLNDIIAANMVGMKTVWKKDNQWKNVKADYTIEDLQEISLIIGELNK